MLVNEIDAIKIPSPFIESKTETNSEKIQAEALLNKVLFYINGFRNNFICCFNCPRYIHKEFELDVADLKRFIIENDGEYLLKRYSENSSLSDPNRKTLVALIVKKLTSQHSYWPTTAQKIKYAKLAVELFPIYKTDTDNFYVSIHSVQEFLYVKVLKIVSVVLSKFVIKPKI